MIKVGLDFDGTLTQREIQDYALQLIQDGVDVHIVTYRYSDEALSKEINKAHAKFWEATRGSLWVYNRLIKDSYSHDVYRLASSLGIPEENIHFTNGVRKGNFYKNNPDFQFHIDDNPEEIVSIKEESTVEAILYPEGNWNRITWNYGN